MFFLQDRWSLSSKSLMWRVSIDIFSERKEILKILLLFEQSFLSVYRHEKMKRVFITKKVKRIFSRSMSSKKRDVWKCLNIDLF